MIRVILYQLFILFAVIVIWLLEPLGFFPEWLADNTLPIKCVLTAMVGGALYCMRAIYINKSVNNVWDEKWETWYFLRPLTSAICGFAAYIFLKAGLVVLESEQTAGAGDYGFLTLAFLAGLNVDRFVAKVEGIAESNFGIEKSRPGNKT